MGGGADVVTLWNLNCVENPATERPWPEDKNGREKGGEVDVGDGDNKLDIVTLASVSDCGTDNGLYDCSGMSVPLK